ncbi:FUSC family protein [Paraburkholderia bonniea]|uniref:FUSC family protein n=1 Tax=Paraburkholderia bonniea TaxID=2152891 RepID=UPI001290E608|nr:FUSC family protein [Paraburkholderia bonniea]WJF91673.1 FUSC family protein [Paraburkholderia bonniea]WJF94992.1 FUSC family protein [Paraburkholderia bonniea]
MTGKRIPSDAGADTGLAPSPSSAADDVVTRRLAPPRSRLNRLWRSLTSPFYRYRHAKLIHSLRVGLAMLVSILATTGIDVPHGIWASVTLLVVIGGLQHHGNIRKKATERAAGTLLGAALGLALIVQQNLLGSLTLTYVLMSVVAAVCAWYAIGKAGYVALLTAITTCIVAGHGDNLIGTGLWRTLNVLVGIVIALAFSFALPLHATYSWRYLLADNLRECAGVYARLVDGTPFSSEAQIKVFMRLNTRLVQLRSLMPSVAKEIQVPQAQLEEIQRLHRSLLSALEMMVMGTFMQTDVVRKAYAQQCGAEVREVRGVLLAMARALRFTVTRSFQMPAAPAVVVTPPGLASHLAPELQGPFWLGQRLAEQVERLRSLLAETAPGWHIEQRPGKPAERCLPGNHD